MDDVIRRHLLSINTIVATAVAQLNDSSDEDGEEKETTINSIDHRVLARSKRTKLQHSEALHCINRDYLGPTPVFNGKEFNQMFRISRRRYEIICQEIVKLDTEFYNSGTDCIGRESSSIQCKILLPLKCLAFGVPPHAFRDYFQMSKTLACQSYTLFMKYLYKAFKQEYLQLPTKNDVKQILQLHEEVHGIKGMMGSLDCMHVPWKNCPKVYQAAFQGKLKKPAIILEAVYDFNLWFWHASFGFPSAMNDLNILNLSPFLDSFLDGTFAALEQDFIPFTIGSYFFFLFFLADGIYPCYSRFLATISEPILDDEKIYAMWQECTRKDIECGFGVLQSKFQVILLGQNWQ